jgi:hypothetical protein
MLLSFCSNHLSIERREYTSTAALTCCCRWPVHPKGLRRQPIVGFQAFETKLSAKTIPAICAWPMKPNKKCVSPYGLLLQLGQRNGLQIPPMLRLSHVTAGMVMVMVTLVRICATFGWLEGPCSCVSGVEGYVSILPSLLCFPLQTNLPFRQGRSQSQIGRFRGYGRRGIQGRNEVMYGRSI